MPAYDFQYARAVNPVATMVITSHEVGFTLHGIMGELAANQFLGDTAESLRRASIPCSGHEVGSTVAGSSKHMLSLSRECAYEPMIALWVSALLKQHECLHRVSAA